ncbi:hypothetical protein BJ742DRAFT_800345 [Cladochytrium replicatum]|nr:hypothetical protein BJ742DRAFT_800345 [Cladochytrium replicatum]
MGKRRNDGDVGEDIGKKKKKGRKKEKREKRHERYAGPISPISTDDYFQRASEFQIYLSERRQKHLGDMSSVESHMEFEKFVKRWNNGKLEEKYYIGILSSEIPAAARTQYKWKFKNVDDVQLEAAKDSVDSLNRSTQQLVYHMQPQKPEESSSSRRGPVGPQLPKALDTFELEEAREQARLKEKRERRALKEREDVALEDIAPKPADAREAQLEKKRAETAYHRSRAEKDYDVELNDADLMGGDDFKARIAARDRAKARREEAKAARQTDRAGSLSERAAVFQQKEQATMDMFRQMAMQRQQQQQNQGPSA